MEDHDGKSYIGIGASHIDVHKIWGAFWRLISHTVAGIVWASGVCTALNTMTSFECTHVLDLTMDEYKYSLTVGSQYNKGTCRVYVELEI